MTARRIPPETRERLAKLVPRLASSFEGERVATVAAIERVLESDGLDWHDLTAVIQRAEAPPQRRHQPPPTTSGDDAYLRASALTSLVERIEIRGQSRLSDRSRLFLRDMHARARRFNPVRLSRKQAKWLGDLARQTGVAA